MSRLIELFREDEWAPLLLRIRKRYEIGKFENGRIPIHHLPENTREALSRLLGKRLKTDAQSFNLMELESFLIENGIAASLKSAIETILGPIKNIREDQISKKLGWKNIFEAAVNQLNPEQRKMSVWLSSLQSSGLLKRYSQGEIHLAKKLLTDAVSIVNLFPFEGLTLAEVAATELGDSHALDDHMPLAKILLRAIRHWNNDSITERRELWASIGILTDELSSSVLVLNLDAETDSLSGKALSIYANHGEPFRLTLRNLTRHPPRFPRMNQEEVYICENPMVVAAASDRLGIRCKPLICVEGNPTQKLGETVQGSGRSPLIKAGILKRSNFKEHPVLSSLFQTVRDFDFQKREVVRIDLDSLGIKIKGTLFSKRLDGRDNLILDLTHIYFDGLQTGANSPGMSTKMADFIASIFAALIERELTEGGSFGFRMIADRILNAKLFQMLKELGFKGEETVSTTPVEYYLKTDSKIEGLICDGKNILMKRIYLESLIK